MRAEGEDAGGLRTSDLGLSPGGAGVPASGAGILACQHYAVTNAALSSKQVRAYCKLDDACQALLTRAVERLGLSARAYERIRKVARTIADLDGSEHIQVPHLAEAIQYRSGEERLRG
jgi:predicted ATPase with chaperone activity